MHLPKIVLQPPSLLNHLFRRSIAFAGASLVSAGCLANSPLHPAHMASPEHYEVLLENDNVLVLKMVLEPGEQDKFHTHNNETVYFQKGSLLRIQTNNGDVIEADIPDEYVMWHEAWGHQVTNIGDTQAIAIIVEEK